MLFFNDVDSLIDYVKNTHLYEEDSTEHLLPYQVQFVNCQSSMTNEKRKKLVQMHKSSLCLLSENKTQKERYKNNAGRQEWFEKEHKKMKIESAEERANRLEKIRQFKKCKQVKETFVERSSRLLKKRQFKKLQTNSETAGERSLRLARKRQCEQFRRKRESSVDRSLRLARKRKCEQLRRKRESCVDRSLRLARKRKCEQLRRKRESCVDRSFRLARKRKCEQLRTKSETCVERSFRLARKRKCEQLRRKCETIMERSFRLARMRKCEQLRRKSEARVERSFRLARMRQCEQLRRKGETCVEKSFRLARKRQCEQVMKKSETFVERSLRLKRRKENEKMREASDSIEKKILRLANKGRNGKLMKEKETLREKSSRPNRPLEQLATQTGTTFNRSAQPTALPPTRINEVVNYEHFRQQGEFEVNGMQREFELLCASFSSARNALNVIKFLTDIKEGPYYICVCCNRMLYRKTVRKFHRNAYTIDIFTNVRSFDNKEYICNMWHLKVTKGKIPCQGVCNKLLIDEVPSELEALRKLESVLIAQRLVFQKIIVMSKGQQRKIKGTICNVPINCEMVCNSLPRPSEQSGVILLKLKRKLKYSGHQYCEAVRPEFLHRALEFLKENNELYQNVEICMQNLEEHPLQTINSNDSVEKKERTETETGNIINESNVCNSEPVQKQISEEEEEIDDPQNEFRVLVSETCLESYVPDYPVEVTGYTEEIPTTSNDNSQCIQLAGNEVCSIAPGEGKHPVHFMQDKYCEELAFPVLFSNGRFGYQVESEIKLSPSKYFNARLLNYAGRFAGNPEYLFFAQYITEQKKVQDSINIALKKVHGQQFTSSQVREMSSSTLNHLIFSDQAYYFMKNIPGSPAYWKTFLFDVVAMIKQLGPPTWWMTFSCADLRWNEIYRILSKLKGQEISDTEIANMTYDEKCKMLNSNPVVVAKHFQYHVECLFRDVLLGSGDPVGKVLYDAIRIKFQFRGSPSAHCFIWIKDCPILNEDNIEYFIRFIDKHVLAILPDPITCPVLHDLVKTYQRHTHSKTSRKYKNLACRFNFGHFFTEKTIVAEPIPKNIDEEEKKEILKERECILTRVKAFINEFLNPSDKDNYKQGMTVDSVLSSI